MEVGSPYTKVSISPGEKLPHESRWNLPEGGRPTRETARAGEPNSGRTRGPIYV